MYQLTLDIDAFLANDWQQRPQVYKGAFADFVDPISADELAGLACEEEISSRIVLTRNRNWEVIPGPFEDFDRYGESGWQLLVQAVNHWHPDTQPLVEAFRFIPDWRFDDLMVSFATPQGGIGPHIDNYDVFIIQGEGRRRWMVGDRGNYRRRDDNPSSPLIEDFKPIIDIILEKGDMLYIPPGFPHRGETLTMALSYSMGFRAPSQQELTGQIADLLLDQDRGQRRFISVNGSLSHGRVSVAEQDGIMQLIRDLCDERENVISLLGPLLSQNRFELDIQEDPSMDESELHAALEDGAVLRRIGGLKVIFMEGDNTPRLFVAGESVTVPGANAEELLAVARNVIIGSTLPDKEHWQVFFVDMLKKGYYYLAEE